MRVETCRAARKMCLKNRRAPVVLLAAVSGVSFASTQAWADRYWVGPANGSWNNAANWSATAGGPGGAGVPTTGEFVYLRFSDAIDRNIVLDVTTPVLSRVRLGNTSTGLTTLIQSSNVTLNTVAEFEGSNASGLNGSGVHTQSAGLNKITWFLSVGEDSGSGAGTYNLSGSGSMIFDGTAPQMPANPGIYVGNSESGVFNQNGGTVNITYDGAPLTIGNNGNGFGQGTGAGTYNLVTGSLTVKAVEYVGYHGFGTFVQSGGVHNVGTPSGPNFLELALYSGSTGNYFLSDGSLNSNAEVDIGNAGAGTFDQSGGTHTIGTARSMYLGWDTTGNGTYHLSGSGVLSDASNMFIGYSGKGTFNQNGGSNTSAGLLLGYNATGTGTYNLSDGSLLVNGNGLYVGTYGKGLFNQDGGTVTLGATIPLIIGYAGSDLGYATSFGTYALSGEGVLTALNSEYVGYYGAGTFIQNGGTHTVGTAIAPANLTISFAPDSSGNLILNDGALTVFGSEVVGSGDTGVVTQSGGTHTVGSGFSAQSLQIGAVNSFGIYTLSGTGVLTVLGKEIIGSGAAGSFTQSGGINTVGADVFAGSLEIGLGTSFAAQGTYALSGDGALNVNGNELIGHGTGSQPGLGTFLHSGGTNTVGTPISPRNLYIGRSDGSLGSGTYLLSGTGNLVVNGSAYLGGSEFGAGGVGYMNISGGSMTVTNTLKVWNTAGSAITLSGGELTAGLIDTSGNPARFIWTSGSLNLNNSYALVSGGFLGSAVNLTALKSLAVSGTTSGDGTAPLTINGGIFSTGSLTNSALMQFNTGTFRLTNASLTIGATGLFGNVLQLNANQHIDISPSSVTVDPGAQLLMNSSTAYLSGGSLTNNGTISGTGQIGNELTNSASGFVRVATTDWLQFTGANNENDGQFNLLGGELDFSGTLVNNGTITGRGVLGAAGGLTNNGQVQLSAGLGDVFGPVTNIGRITITGGNTTTFHDPVDTTTGSITVNTNNTVVFLGDLTGQGQISGPGVKDFEGGASLGPIATVVGSTVVGPSGNVTTDFVHENSFLIQGHTAITHKATPNDPAGTSIVKSLVISPGGELDLSNNSMIIDYDGSPGTLLSDIRQDLRSGRLTSSDADAHTYRIGYADNSLLELASFAGQSVDADSLLIKYTFSGDANLDGKTNLQDLIALARHWNSGGAVWSDGDFNYDSVVNVADLSLLASNWQAGVDDPLLATLLASLGLPQVGVPEPSMLGLFLLLGASLTARRRRT